MVLPEIKSFFSHTLRLIFERVDHLFQFLKAYSVPRNTHDYFYNEL
jgi:hypothetical protein